MRECKCFVCNKSFLRKESQIKRAKYNYCSYRCRNEHYKIIRRAEKNYHWKGGYNLKADGYVDIYSPNHPDANFHGYVAEHRVVMEKKIGRRLQEKEIVHHINRIKNDNRPENLEILFQSQHIREHMKELLFDRKRAKNGRWLPK